MRKFPRLLQMSIVATAMTCGGTSSAQEQYPSREIKIIVPFPAGGGTDITARLLGEQLRKILGQSTVIDNRAGASGMIGTQAVAKATPDGYLLLVASGEMAVNPHLYKSMAYDWEKDLATITNLVKVPNVLVVNADVPAKSVQELIAYAKDNPRKLTFSSSGIGNPQQLTGELFNKMAGVQIIHVPYKGAAPQIADVAGNRRRPAVHRQRQGQAHRRHLAHARVDDARRAGRRGIRAAGGFRRGEFFRVLRAGQHSGSDTPETQRCGGTGIQGRGSGNQAQGIGFRTGDRFAGAIPRIRQGQIETVRENNRRREREARAVMAR